ncbi:MAG: ferrous iron transporter B [Deltaproteobacteria bacterium]|jgi:ferrous iron transport protein B|nr:ferrous iron transporter B [Deltaproteobacteria bacterium]
MMDENAGIAIVGNMNVGKSALFSRMSGTKTASLNISGNTTSITTGHVKNTEREIFDTPGIFSIFSTDEDDRLSRDLLLPHTTDKDIRGIILVADAKNLKRSIAIALQYAEYGLPMLLDINMIDEAPPRGIEIDAKKLSETLGIDVFTTIANEGIGVSKVMSGITEMRVPNRLVEYPEKIEQFLQIVAKLLKSESISTRATGLLLLAGDSGIEGYVETRFGSGMLEQLKDLSDQYQSETPISCGILLGNLYNKIAGQIVDDVQEIHPPPKSPFLMKFGDWCTKLSTGIPIAVIFLYAMYLFVGSFGATFAVDTINGTLFEGFLIPWTTKLVQPIPSAFIRDMIVDPDFGILPTGVFLALGLVAPVLFCFYIAFGILEDSGYLPRVSILLDKLFQKMGLNGKGVIPLVMGFSCVTMAILTTRLLDTKKEKNIASFLLFLALPCAPLVAVMLIILEQMPVSATITLFGLILSQVLIAGILANKILSGYRTPLFMEIPAMRFPKLHQIIRMSFMKTYFFMKEALPVFIIASFFVFLFERAGGLDWLEQITGPFFSKLMGLPEESIRVFIKTMIRREVGATELDHLSGSYTNLQLVVNLLVMTFIIPCVNATIVLFKERGIKVAAAICVSVTIYAVVVGSIVNHTCHLFGITFT